MEDETKDGSGTHAFRKIFNQSGIASASLSSTFNDVIKFDGSVNELVGRLRSASILIVESGYAPDQGVNALVGPISLDGDPLVGLLQVFSGCLQATPTAKVGVVAPSNELLLTMGKLKLNIEKGTLEQSTKIEPVRASNKGVSLDAPESAIVSKPRGRVEQSSNERTSIDDLIARANSAKKANSSTETVEDTFDQG